MLSIMDFKAMRHNCKMITRCYSYRAANGNVSECPFLANSKTTPKVSKITPMSISTPKTLCPMINVSQSKILPSNLSLHRHNKMLFSASGDILNDPLYPKRDGLDETEFGGNIEWREGEPVDYSIVNATYLRERKGKWKDANSLENIVSNLIKTLEMEITNKSDPKQWISMSPDVFKYKANNGDWITTTEAVEKGTYNILMSDADPNLYDKSMSFEQSHQSFFNAFPNGFVWELLKVYSGPPKVSFTWRHWGKFNGHFNENKGNGQEINVYGFGSANVQMPSDKDPRIRIKDFQVYYDIDRFLSELTGTKYSAIQDPVFGYVGDMV